MEPLLPELLELLGEEGDELAVVGAAARWLDSALEWAAAAQTHGFVDDGWCLALALPIIIASSLFVESSSGGGDSGKGAGGEMQEGEETRSGLLRERAPLSIGGQWRGSTTCRKTGWT